MLETSARLLRLLSLLQSRRDWTGTELAGRLGVGLRTLRRDIGRLRDLGYPVDAAPGVAGGYRLGVGAALPPLLLDDEEAVAVAISLHIATTGSVAGLEETALRALTKLQQTLPSRLRHRVTAFHATTVPLAGPGSGQADAELLTVIAAACRDQRRLRLRYPGRDGVSTREVEPHRLVHTPRRWYLLAWDTGRGDWRTFRVDRIQGPLSPAGARFTPRKPPSDDVAAYVSQSIASAPYRYQARILVHAPLAAVARRSIAGRRAAGSRGRAQLRAAHRVRLARRARPLCRRQGLRLPGPRPARARSRRARPVRPPRPRRRCVPGRRRSRVGRSAPAGTSGWPRTSA